MIRTIIGSLLVLAGLLLSGAVAHAQDDLTRRSSWQAPTAEQVEAHLNAWLVTRDVSEQQRQQIQAMWNAAESETGEPAADQSPSNNLALLVESAALVWPAAAEVVEETRHAKVGPVVKHFDMLKHPPVKAAEDTTPHHEQSEGEAPADEEPVEEIPVADTTAEEQSGEEATEKPEAAIELSAAELEAWMVDNLRLHYARWLAQHELYDESLELIEPLEVAAVVDPASLLFYQSAAYHFLLNKTKGLETIDKLLENEQRIAKRYAVTAKLMAADLKPLKTDSLDEVARMMDDIERRLRLQRAGKRVRQEEEEVVAKLDKMIEELEKQQQQSSSSSSSGGSSNNPSAPMQDSQIGGASGEGNVDPKQLSNRENWGNLPPKERQEALQQITKELPAHYREAVEEYFRKLARDGVDP